MGAGMVDDRTESERKSLHYFECLDRVTRVFAQASDVEALIRQTLCVVLEIFCCDRAWLLFPCDPEAKRWRIIYEATQPERPGALAMNVDFPMDEAVAAIFRDALQTPDPVTYGVHRAHPWSGAPNFDIQSEIHIALRPRRGAPWLLGMHQCSYARDWSPEEARLFHEIAQRLADALTNILYTRELEQTAQALRDSEALLRKSEAALREADRRKDEFIGMLSHELRNPLAPIRNCLYILDRAVPGSEQAKRAQAVIDRQVRHMTRLVDDLLDITRIARGKIQLQRERIELGALVRRTIEDHRTELLASGCDLEVAVAEEALWADVDATRIAQVIGNLLQNAAKFTPRGGKISVSLGREHDAAILCVRDTGIGIAADMLEKVFEPFTQADNSLDRSLGGLGLGLALVKGLVEMHGGSVSATSEGVGKGASFLLSLPLAEAPS